MESCLILLSLLIPAGNPWALAGEPATDIGAFNLASDELKLPEHQAVLVLTAKWCGPCQQMVRNTYPPLIARGWRVSDYGVKTEKDPHVILIDVDKHPELMKRFQVTNLPTIVSWTGRSEAARRIGYLDAFGIRDAWADGSEKESPVVRQYSARWTFPGSTRQDLIDHLSSESHNYMRQALQRMSTDRLYQLHDSDHDKRVAKPKRQRWSLPFIQFGSG